MYNVGDKVKCTIQDEDFLGEVIEMIEPLKYRVEVEDYDENRFEEIFYEDELELIPITYLSKRDLIKIIRYEANLEDYVDPDASFMVVRSVKG